MMDEDDIRADAWDLGYQTALDKLEAVIHKAMVVGISNARKDLKPATNPYRKASA